METISTMTLDPEALRSAMRTWSAGVTVVTAAHGEDRHGMTVNSFTSVSLNPATVSVTLQKNTRTHALVQRSGAFGVTILAEDQAHISDLFAGRNPEVTDRLTPVQTETLITGSPFIVGGLAWLDCRVVHTYDAGGSTLFIAEVIAVREAVGEPLIYHDRGYWKLAQK